MQLISANKYFGKNLQEKLTSAIVFIFVSLLLAKLAGAIATPQGFRHIAYSSLATVIIKRF